MLHHFHDSWKADDLYNVVWSCVLAPDAVPELSRVVELAARTVELEQGSMRTLQVQGAALFRAGKYDEALQVLQQSDAAPTQALTLPFDGWYFLAMTHFKLGHSGEARAWLKKGDEWNDSMLNDRQQNIPWDRKLKLELLRREARALIDPEGSSVDEPRPPAVESPRD